VSISPSEGSPEFWFSDERIEIEVRRQRLIEAAFDRADDHSRSGDDERALHWLDTAAALSGGLSRAYQLERSRLTGRLARAR